MDIVTGDDEDIEITVTNDGTSFVISESAVIKAALVDKNSNVLAGPIPVSTTAYGSDLPNSKIVVRIPGRSTASIKNTMPATLEIQVSDAGSKKTWFSKVMLVKGTIG